ncbi:MAG: hypothetical protein M1825_000992 [Sarcosagium campestre]|nr:MAG: hypothetical protein M1825_000992 [Sarcosagium campestre]
MLLLNNPKEQYRRIESGTTPETFIDRKESFTETGDGQSSALAGSHAGNGTSESSNLHSRLGSAATSDPVKSPSLDRTFYWQSYPTDSLQQRISWVADFMTNFRGIGWNWGVSGLPPPPREVQAALDNQPGPCHSTSRPYSSPSGNVRYPTRSTLLRRKALLSLTCYLVLDACKVIMMHDPYFWGLVDSNPPAPSYLPDAVRASHFLTKAYRQLLSLAGIYFALQGIFSAGPLLFVGLLGEKQLGVRAAPWMYPDLYGSFVSVLDKGLAGWWSAWWHQIFRFSFSAPSTWAIERWRLDRRAPATKLLQLVVAFTMSGSLHASGSFTQWGRTRPLTGPFAFFFLQTFGIVAQLSATLLLKRSGVLDRTPRLLRRTVNFVYVHAWLYWTAPLMTNDLARGGIWLMEVVPLSPVRGLGFGGQEDGWWCWGGRWAYWHRGRGWWDTGVAF